MVKEKACSRCRMVYTGNVCPNCSETTTSDTFKGKVIILNPSESEMAKNMKITSKGEFAIKVK